MADSAHLSSCENVAPQIKSWNELADSYPPHVGWVHCDAKTKTVLTLNALYLTRDEDAFPLMARVRLYEKGREVATHFTRELMPMDSVSVDLNELLEGRPLKDGYMEVAAYSLREEGMAHPFFGEMWASVYTADGDIALNYPPLNFKGVDAKMVDADYLYYPGVHVDERFTMALLMLNQYDFDMHYDLTLSDASGRRKLERRLPAPAKSVSKILLEEEFEDLAGFFADGPGLLVTRFPYKMNGYVQTILKSPQRICGMDHLGYLAMHNPKGIAKIVAPETANRRRLTDNVVCYCKSVPESHLKGLQAQGLNYAQIQSECGAGTVCKGCVADLKRVLGEPLISISPFNI